MQNNEHWLGSKSYLVQFAEDFLYEVYIYIFFVERKVVCGIGRPARLVDVDFAIELVLLTLARRACTRGHCD